MIRLALSFAVGWLVGPTLLRADGSSLPLADPGQEPVSIVCLGDSVTGVYYHTGGKAAYPEMLEVALRRVYPRARISVVNAGISGNTTKDGLNRLDRDVLARRPNVVTISFGLNDLVRVSPEDFDKNLSELVTRCRAAGSRVVLCTPNAVVDTPARPIAKLTDYCERIRQAAARNDVPVCDQFAAGESRRRMNAADWRLSMSDEIHPNTTGHKWMAEELCRVLTGRSTSLDDVRPSEPALAKTWEKLAANKSVRVLAMPPYDAWIAPALRSLVPQAAIEVTPWPTAGKSVAEIEQTAKATVRTMKPDLVIVAVPRTADAPADAARSEEVFARSFTWTMNWSLSFGRSEWDCLIVHPAVADPGAATPRDDLVRRLVRAQHLHLVDRSADESSAENQPGAEQVFARKLRDDFPSTEPVRLEQGLVGHWPLRNDGRDVSGNNRDAAPHGVEFAADVANGDEASARFDGSDSYLEVPAARAPRFGKGDFSIALRVRSPRGGDDLPGDLVTAYDPRGKRGFQLSLKTNAGVTSNQANLRHLTFAIDAERDSEWVDCGRPGEAVLAFALAAHDGELYAGTCEPGKGPDGHDRAGRVYRYAGGKQWIDCGAPDLANAVTALAVHDGKLYAGTGKYRLAGSALTESENPNLGGKVFRYEGGQSWTLCGQLPGVEAVGGLVEFGGRLYASSLYKPAGFFRYEQGTEWTDCGVPDEKRVEALGVFDGGLYAGSYDGGKVYRYDGQSWADEGTLGDNTQTYSFAVYQRRLYVGTWPSGRVFRRDGPKKWADVGRLGEELEVMGMLVHNGRLIAGTLPTAEVYEFDGRTDWRRLARLDNTPNVKYRRAWTMAEHRGRLYCSTLPTGHIHSYAAGVGAAWEHEFPDGGHHVAAVKQGGELRLYVDGAEVARSAAFDVEQYDLDTDGPLYLGRGMNDDFRGRMSDVRLYDRGLSKAEIQRLAETPAAPDTGATPAPSSRGSSSR
jgi:lysophospholipase L1-like esterase